MKVFDILRHAKKGLELYSPLLGNVIFDGTSIVNIPTIDVVEVDQNNITHHYQFDENGYLLHNNRRSARVMLLPSLAANDWQEWQMFLFRKGDIITTQYGKTGILKIDKALNFIFYTVDTEKSAISQSYMTFNEIVSSKFASPEERRKFYKDLEKSGFVIMADDGNNFEIVENDNTTDNNETENSITDFDTKLRAIKLAKELIACLGVTIEDLNDEQIITVND